MADIIYKTDENIFGYRVAGICVQNGKVLLQKPENDDAYAFPGGHAEFGETNEETLKREFREEMGAETSVGELKWVGELFFPWDNRACQQICLYYMIDIESPQIPRNGSFTGKEQLQGQVFDMDFYWVELDKVGELKTYPENAAELLEKLDTGVQHFIYRE